MTKIQQQILFGTLLGDAYIKKDKNGAYVTFEQSSKHEPYIEILAQYFSSFNIIKNTYERTDPRYGTTNSVYIKLTSIPEFLPFATMFLDDKGNKIVPSLPLLLENLTVIAFAFWIIDDGQHVLRGGVTLCTDSFTLEEVERLRIALHKLYNLTTTIHIKKGKNDQKYYRIYVSRNSVWLELIPQLATHIHPIFFI